MAPPIFGWAAITLGIGPHSSFIHKRENAARKYHVMAAPPNRGVEENGTPFSAAFLVQRRKVLLTPTACVPCSNAANIGQLKTCTQSEFCTWENSVRGREPQNVYILLAQETAKNRANIG